MYYNEKTKYGTIIYNDNTISKTTIYQFDNLEILEQFWNERRQGEGEWTAHLDRGTIENKKFVSSDDFFDNTRGEEE